MKRLIILFLFVFSAAAFAQDITNTISSNGYFYIKDAVNTFFRLQQSNGHAGLGTNVSATPRAQLEIGGTDGLLVTGTPNSGTVYALGSGLRLHWYPRKGAFRVGMAETSYWDDNGTSVTNMALYSVGMGYQVRATGVASTAIGAYNKATADYSLSLGSYSYASGSHAIALGTQVMASGIYSIAIGAGADTNGKDGSVVVGDDTYFQTAYASADNQITMRFSGGYRFWSSYPDSVSGVYMRHGQSGWSNYCDRNKKENFTPVDGEWLLSKIRNIPITRWNYKKTDVNEKYIGPMAQDFYAAFQLGGTDSLGINTICIDGVNMAGVQALEKRTSEMRSAIAQLKEQNEYLTAENKKLREEYAEIKDIKNELAQIKQLKAELEEQVRTAKIGTNKEKVIAANNGLNK
jgi:regulator of replication initiation timing